MKIKLEQDYDLGVLVEEVDEDDNDKKYKEYIHKGWAGDEKEVSLVYVDTNNNPTKTNKLFHDIFQWDPIKLSNWIKEKMNV